jgi:hypothetical protein
MVGESCYRHEDVIKLLKALKDGSVLISDVNINSFDININLPYYIPKCLLIDCETSYGTGCIYILPIKNYTKN